MASVSLQRQLSLLIGVNSQATELMCWFNTCTCACVCRVCISECVRSVQCSNTSELCIMDVNPLTGLPHKQALYDPQFERDACGVGFVVNIDGIRCQKVSHSQAVVTVGDFHCDDRCCWLSLSATVTVSDFKCQWLSLLVTVTIIVVSDFVSSQQSRCHSQQLSLSATVTVSSCPCQWLSVSNCPCQWLC